MKGRNVLPPKKKPEFQKNFSLFSRFMLHPFGCIGHPWQIVESQLSILSFPLVSRIDDNRREFTSCRRARRPPPQPAWTLCRKGLGGKAPSLSIADWSWFLSLTLGERGDIRASGKVGLPSFRTFDESQREHR